MNHCGAHCSVRNSTALLWQRVYATIWHTWPAAAPAVKAMKTQEEILGQTALLALDGLDEYTSWEVKETAEVVLKFGTQFNSNTYGGLLLTCRDKNWANRVVAANGGGKISLHASIPRLLTVDEVKLICEANSQVVSEDCQQIWLKVAEDLGGCTGRVIAMGLLVC
eukprot:TRINITY_DN68086_c1_g1_i10.p1 TRINITY_DN68086_c1_g1~~TRINITY_DN68086_c1_g1_i10.p1  ORF type:complete len:166 (-),score=18.65 TRINITY_DN68086_c1_g1_i10:209-706(-)